MSKKKPKARKLSVAVKSENFALLKWIKFSTNRNYSDVINSLLDIYREGMTENMTDYEKRQIENLQYPGHGAIFSHGELEELSTKAAALVAENITRTINK